MSVNFFLFKQTSRVSIKIQASLWSYCETSIQIFHTTSNMVIKIACIIIIKAKLAKFCLKSLGWKIACRMAGHLNFLKCIIHYISD